jgi:exosortase
MGCEQIPVPHRTERSRAPEPTLVKQRIEKAAAGAADGIRLPEGADWRVYAPVAAAAAAFLLLFWEPIVTLGRDWWNDPEAGHGLLLGPLAVWLAYRKGVIEGSVPNRTLGGLLLLGAVLLRYGSDLAAELFTMRFSLWLGLVALVVYLWGVRQAIRWWLPAALLLLSIPLPSVVLGSLALPLQLKASEMGAALLEWRDVPVLLSGNVLHLPGQSLFVTEACSGLRSLTALLSLGVLIGGLWLKHPVSRVILIALAVPVAMLLNGIRVFLTGFLVFYVSPAMGQGLMHYTEGWVTFTIAFVILGGVAWVLTRSESLLTRVRGPLAEARA